MYILGAQGNVGQRGKDGNVGQFGPSGIKGNIKKLIYLTSLQKYRYHWNYVQAIKVLQDTQD